MGGYITNKIIKSCSSLSTQNDKNVLVSVTKNYKALFFPYCIQSNFESIKQAFKFKSRAN